MSEQERAKCPKCGADVSRRAADYLACGAPVVACWTCKTWKSPDGMLHPSDACRIRERDARIAALELDRDRANQAGMDAVFAVAVICEKLGLPPDTPPAKVAEEAGRQLTELRRVDCYWDDRDLEAHHDSVVEATSGDHVGDVVALRPVHELPTIYVLVTRQGPIAYSTPAAAEAARGEQTKG